MDGQVRVHAYIWNVPLYRAATSWLGLPIGCTLCQCFAWCQQQTHVSVAATEKNIGIVFSQKGDYENALLRFRKALEIEEKCLGRDHVSVASTKQNIGIVYQKMGDHMTARSIYKDAYDIFLRSLGPDHPTTRGLAPFI